MQLDTALIFFLSFSQVKPLIWVESIIERHAHSRVEYMVKVSLLISMHSFSTFLNGKPFNYDALMKSRIRPKNVTWLSCFLCVGQSTV